MAEEDNDTEDDTEDEELSNESLGFTPERVKALMSNADLGFTPERIKELMSKGAPAAAPQHQPDLDSGVIGSAARGAVEAVPGVVGGLPGFGLGQIAGRAVGPAIGRVVGGTLGSWAGPVGAIGGAFIGGYLGDKLADFVAEQAGLREGTGIFSRAQQQADVEQHPYAREAGGLAATAGAFAVNPAASIGARIASGGFFGATQAAGQLVSEGTVDPVKTGMAALTGMAFPTPRPWASKLMGIPHPATPGQPGRPDLKATPGEGEPADASVEASGFGTKEEVAAASPTATSDSRGVATEKAAPTDVKVQTAEDTFVRDEGNSGKYSKGGFRPAELLKDYMDKGIPTPEEPAPKTSLEMSADGIHDDVKAALTEEAAAPAAEQPKVEPTSNITQLTAEGAPDVKAAIEGTTNAPDVLAKSPGGEYPFPKGFNINNTSIVHSDASLRPGMLAELSPDGGTVTIDPSVPPTVNVNGKPLNLAVPLALKEKIANQAIKGEQARGGTITPDKLKGFRAAAASLAGKALKESGFDPEAVSAIVEKIQTRHRMAGQKLQAPVTAPVTPPVPLGLEDLQNRGIIKAKVATTPPAPGQEGRMLPLTAPFEEQQRQLQAISNAAKKPAQEVAPTVEATAEAVAPLATKKGPTTPFDLARHLRTTKLGQDPDMDMGRVAQRLGISGRGTKEELIEKIHKEIWKNKYNVEGEAGEVPSTKPEKPAEVAPKPTAKPVDLEWKTSEEYDKPGVAAADKGKEAQHPDGRWFDVDPAFDDDANLFGWTLKIDGKVVGNYETRKDALADAIKQADVTAAVTPPGAEKALRGAEKAKAAKASNESVKTPPPIGETTEQVAKRTGRSEFADRALKVKAAKAFSKPVGERTAEDNAIIEKAAQAAKEARAAAEPPVKAVKAKEEPKVETPEPVVEEPKSTLIPKGGRVEKTDTGEIVVRNKGGRPKKMTLEQKVLPALKASDNRLFLDLAAKIDKETNKAKRDQLLMQGQTRLAGGTPRGNYEVVRLRDDQPIRLESGKMVRPENKEAYDRADKAIADTYEIAQRIPLSEAPIGDKAYRTFRDVVKDIYDRAVEANGGKEFPTDTHAPHEEKDASWIVMDNIRHFIENPHPKTGEKRGPTQKGAQKLYNSLLQTEEQLKMDRKLEGQQTYEPTVPDVDKAIELSGKKQGITKGAVAEEERYKTPDVLFADIPKAKPGQKGGQKLVDNHNMIRHWWNDDSILSPLDKMLLTKEFDVETDINTTTQPEKLFFKYNAYLDAMKKAHPELDALNAESEGGTTSEPIITAADVKKAEKRQADAAWEAAKARQAEDAAKQSALRAAQKAQREGKGIVPERGSPEYSEEGQRAQERREKTEGEVGKDAVDEAVETEAKVGNMVSEFFKSTEGSVDTAKIGKDVKRAAAIAKESVAHIMDRFVNWGKADHFNLFSNARIKPAREYADSMGNLMARRSHVSTIIKQLSQRVFDPAIKFYEDNKMTHDDLVAIYRSIEDGTIAHTPTSTTPDQLTPNQRTLYNDHIRKMEFMRDDATRKMINANGEIPEGWEKKEIKDPVTGETHDVYDPIPGVGGFATRLNIGGQKFDRVTPLDVMTGKRSISDFASSLEPRKYKALEDKNGNRYVFSVEEKDGENVMTIHNQRTAKGGRAPRYVSMGKEQPDIGNTIELNGMNYKIVNAKVREIAANVIDPTTGKPMSYYENPIINTLHAYEGIAEALENEKMFQQIMPTADKVGKPELVQNAKGEYKPVPSMVQAFRDFTTTDMTVAQERGYFTEPTKLDRFKTWGGDVDDLHEKGKTLFMDKSLKYVMDDYAYPNVIDGEWKKLQNFISGLNKWLFMFASPIHILNETDLAIIEHGKDWFGKQAYKGMDSRLKKAWESVSKQDDFQHQIIDWGGNPMLGATLTKNAMSKMAERFGYTIKENPSRWDPVAKLFGMSAKDMSDKMFDMSNKPMWFWSDVLLTHSVMKHMEQGLSGPEAVQKAHEFISDYRLNSEIMGSRGLAKMLRNPLISMFGRYHVGLWNSLGQTYGKLIKGTPQERAEGFGHLASMAVMLFMAYPALDYLSKQITGNPDASIGRRGLSSLVQAGADIAAGKKNLEAATPPMFTPSMPLSAAIGIGLNRDWRGQPVVSPGAMDSPKAIGRKVVEAGDYAARTMIAPYNTVATASRQPEAGPGAVPLKFAENLVGIHDPSFAARKFDINQYKYQQREAKARFKKPHGMAEEVYNKLFGR